MGEDIENMVNDAEKYKAEDDKQREKVQAKNSLESYCFNMKSTMDEEKVKSAISESEKKTINDKCDECIKWLDANQTAEKDEYEDKQKELEQIFNPIIQKLYAGGAGLIPGGGMPGGAPGGPPPAGGGAGPTIEEVD